MNNNASTNAIKTIEAADFPFLLKKAVEIMDHPPDRLYLRGTLPVGEKLRFLTVVGSRRFTPYGKAACEALIAGLCGLPVVVISGLAYGIDSIAHEAALKHGLKTIAVPGSGLADSMIYPAAHIGLARRILAAGGALLSPFDDTVMGNDWTFPYRNAIMAGMSHAVLIVEAAERSGTLITGNRALDFDRDVFIVPGSIFSDKSRAPFEFLDAGARPIFSSEDLVEALKIDRDEPRQVDTSTLADFGSDERLVFEHISLEAMPRDRLIQKIGLDAARANAAISALEIRGFIEESLGELRKVR